MQLYYLLCSGELLHKFEPTSALDGLACVPAGLHVLLSGNICLCDSLNHMVSNTRWDKVEYKLASNDPVESRVLLSRLLTDF